MKKITALLILVVFILFASTAYAFNRSQGTSSDWGGSKKESYTNVQTKKDSDLKKLYEEFNKYWSVKDADDLQDRFEVFLKSKNIDPDDIDEYDAFMETWVDHYDEDLDFDDLYDEYEFGSDDIDGADEYDILLDDDINDLYDDYLDDYIDEEYYEDYGEYFDEVYYD